jgi:hypothetical protein
MDHRWVVMLALVWFHQFLTPHRLINLLLRSFVVIKIIVGINLISYATRRRASMEEREAADVVNDFGRDPIGEGPEERVGSLLVFMI